MLILWYNIVSLIQKVKMLIWFNFENIKMFKLWYNIVQTCYFDQFAPKCGGCNTPITENYISSLNQQVWYIIQIH